MSGIVGYLGPRRAVPIILDALRRLEYRGYDSAGLAVYGPDGQIAVRRATGKLRRLEEVLRLDPIEGLYGIGHTRWATHGRPTEENAHPHCDCQGNVMVVHNGIIENYAALREGLAAEGHVFRTETDTEVIAHLVEKYLAGGLEEAVRRAARELAGLFAIAVIARSDPNVIVAARAGPPVVIGLGEGEYFVASDVPAILNYTRDVMFLADGDLAALTPDGVRLSGFDGLPVKRRLTHILWDPILAEKGGYPHFTLKEIFEQPRAMRDTLQGRLEPETGSVLLDELEIPAREFREFRQVRVVACGSSWHAALAGKFMLEELARIPVEVDYGSEFRYRDPILGTGVLTVVVSQSGETADTLAALREARQKGSPALAITNAHGSAVSREASGTLLMRAGPEIGVASTKAFTSELTALFLLAMYLGQARQVLDGACSRRLARQLLDLPGQLEQVLSQDAAYQELARRLFRATDFLFLGRGVHYPIALEGALKLKELSYIHAEGYPAGEMKHGPNALLDGNVPVVVLAAYDRERPQSRVLYEKTLASIQEVKAREGLVIALADAGDEEVGRAADYVIEIPPAHELLLPVLEVVPLQLLAYHMAVRRGCDVDQPRNLAKSVTVE
jgi:glucosamine--fructose-6-phosphate aminotransferase (isomerizing)